MLNAFSFNLMTLTTVVNLDLDVIIEICRSRRYIGMVTIGAIDLGTQEVLVAEVSFVDVICVVVNVLGVIDGMLD